MPSRVGVVVALGVFLGAPPAEAQDPQPAGTYDRVAPPDRLAPERGLLQVPLVLRLACTPDPGPKTVTFTIKTVPPWASALLADGTVTSPGPPSECGGIASTQAFRTTFVLSTTRQAPAFLSFGFLIRATANNPTTKATYGPYELNLTVVNDYIPLMKVTPAVYYVKAAPNSNVASPLTFTNLGNGPSRVKTEIHFVGTNRLASIIAPADVALESTATNGPTAMNRKETKIAILTPHSNGENHDVYTFAANFTTRYDGAASNTTMDHASATFTVEVRGFFIPAFETAAWAFAFLAALGRVRRR